MAGGRIKIIGYGNPSRLDDGLGPAMIDLLESENLTNVELETDFQLNIEDLVGLDQYQTVIFVDADVSTEPPFDFCRVKPEADISFSTHSVSPSSLLGLAESHFGISIPGFVLAIRGYEFDDFGETLSPKAQKNLQEAKRFLLDFINHRTSAGTKSPGEMQAATPNKVCEEYHEGR